MVARAGTDPTALPGEPVTGANESGPLVRRRLPREPFAHRPGHQECRWLQESNRSLKTPSCGPPGPPRLPGGHWIRSCRGSGPEQERGG